MAYDIPADYLAEFRLAKMMTSILNLADTAPREVETPGSEYELVLGRAQIASWLFIGVIAIAVCGSLAYLAGETVAAKRTVRAAAVGPAPVPAALPQASLLPKAEPSARPMRPLVGEPELGKVYLQVGAVERGMAVILAEGMRSMESMHLSHRGRMKDSSVC